MMSSGDASYQIEDNRCTMRFERQLAQPIERVWAALTQPDELKAWFYPFEGTLATGEAVVIPWDEDGGLTSKVIEFDPPKVFAWTWHKPGEPESIVRWELAPESTGTRFVLTHSLTALGANEPTDTLAGWHEHIDTLVDHLDGNTRAWSNETWRSHKDRYAFEIEKKRLPDDYGIIEVVNGRRQLHFARVLDAPLAKVWEAVTTSEGVSGWFSKAEVDLRDGGSFALDFTQYGAGVSVCKILKLEPPRVVEFNFGDHEDDVVRFELFADGDRTLFVLTNRLGLKSNAVDQLGGWHYHLDRVPTYLAGESDTRAADHIPQLEAHYKAVFG
ncbi:MAG: SRPBCC family protein [Thermomicrobiales bacterium]